MREPVIIDTDPGQDDAVALLLAFASAERIDLKAITTVAGNVPVAQTTANALRIRDLAGRGDIPVHRGTEGPLVFALETAEFVCGPDGLAGANLPRPRSEAAPGHAVQAIIDICRAAPAEGITLCPLGPLTNLALAFRLAPDILPKVKRIVLMGGAIGLGNITPAAEYNIWVDPEAARTVFRSGLPIEMCGWETCRGEANLTEDEMRYCKEVINTPLAHFAIDCNASALSANINWLGDPGLGLPDPVAMAVAIDPTICTRASKHYVEIECDGTYTRGMTVVDELNVTNYDTANVEMWQPLVRKGEPHITVCWTIDAKRWKALLYDLLK